MSQKIKTNRGLIFEHFGEFSRIGSLTLNFFIYKALVAPWSTVLYMELLTRVRQNINFSLLYSFSRTVVESSIKKKRYKYVK